MVLTVKSINLDGLVHISTAEKLVSETATQTGLGNNVRFNGMKTVCTVQSYY